MIQPLLNTRPNLQSAMIGRALAAVPSLGSSIFPTLSQAQSHAAERNDEIVQDSRALEDVEDPESEERARIKRLGRERPAKFKSIWSEAAFCYSVIASMITAAS